MGIRSAGYINITSLHMFLYYYSESYREHVVFHNIETKVDKHECGSSPLFHMTHLAIEPSIQAERQQCAKQEWFVQEDEKERRVIVSDREDLRRAVHPEQANESVGFVGSVELQ